MEVRSGAIRHRCDHALDDEPFPARTADRVSEDVIKRLEAEKSVNGR